MKKKLIKFKIKYQFIIDRALKYASILFAISLLFTDISLRDSVLTLLVFNIINFK